MSKKSAFREALAQREKTPAVPLGRFNFPGVQAILRAGKIEQPVRLARVLTSFGLSLRKAHEILNRLAQGQLVAVELYGDVREIKRDLDALAIEALPIQPPDVDVKQVRADTRLSQNEFSLLYGLELDTLQNWEQGRYAPDSFAKLLLQIIRYSPELVAAVRMGHADAIASFARLFREHIYNSYVPIGRLSMDFGKYPASAHFQKLPPAWVVKKESIEAN